MNAPCGSLPESALAQQAAIRSQQVGLPTAIPAYSNDAEFFPGMVKKWGIGFMINSEQVPGGRSLGSLTWAGLGNTYFWIDQKKGVAGVIMTQLVPFVDHKVLDLYGKFENAIYSSLM